MRRFSLALVTSGVVLAGTAAALPGAAQSLPAPAPVVITIAPGHNLEAALESLRVTGPTELRLQPGTYDVFERSVIAQPGTAQTRIKVTAADPARPPLIRGSLVLEDPRYWTLDHLTFQGVHSGYEALRMNGGSNWMVLRSEFMGAPGYSAKALLNVAKSASAPHSFRVAYNCFHDGPRNPPSIHDHLVYVTSSLPPSPSYVARNIMFNNPNGSAVKVNSTNVRVTYNTFHNVAGAVTLQQASDSASLTGVTTERNLVHTVRRLPGTDRTKVFWASQLDGKPQPRPKWRLQSNYVFSPNRPTFLWRSYSSARTVQRAGNTMTTNGGNPSFNGIGTCSTYRPGLAAARPYGRWAGDGLSVLPPG